MIEPTEWIWSEPEDEGWYAVLYSWDPDEGIFPGAVQRLNGKWVWDSNAAIGGCAGPFINEEAAKKWADLHDIDG